MAKPTACSGPSSSQARTKMTGADDGDGAVLTVEISLRTFTDGASDFLHACVARVRTHHRIRGEIGVDNGESATGDNPQ